MDSTVYKSKIGFIAFIPVIFIVGIAFAIGYIDHKPLQGALFLGLGGLFIFSFFNTSYTITPGHLLKVKCGVFVNVSIDINAIKRISTTKTMVNCYGLSLDKIELHYNKFDSVVISPKNKNEFIAQLKSINPAVETTQP
ncbi:MAG: hypothetical protein EOP47_30655 [Sphingobacteriaceae bacterium]|nr:MAG: hypothetical protein EOP47_30655 [Sphingobacteriaceae bacterium]